LAIKSLHDSRCSGSSPLFLFWFVHPLLCMRFLFRAANRDTVSSFAEQKITLLAHNLGLWIAFASSTNRKTKKHGKSCERRDKRRQVFPPSFDFPIARGTFPASRVLCALLELEFCCTLNGFPRNRFMYLTSLYFALPSRAAFYCFARFFLFHPSCLLFFRVIRLRIFKSKKPLG
jgi:hypothetical protein